MRVAVWTPLAPEASGIADYNALLLAEMAKDPTVRVNAVVRSSHSELVVPEGVAVVAVEDYRAEDFDILVAAVRRIGARLTGAAEGLQ